MSEYEYKVGDKVEVVPSPQAAFAGMSGTVSMVSGEARAWTIGVRFTGPTPYWFAADELRLLDSVTPDEPDMVEHPNHYSAGTPDGIEVIDILRAHEAAGGTWETMNALKYILRFPFKGNAAQDLAKAEQYLSMWKERESA